MVCGLGRRSSSGGSSFSISPFSEGPFLTDTVTRVSHNRSPVLDSD